MTTTTAFRLVESMKKMRKRHQTMLQLRKALRARNYRSKDKPLHRRLLRTSACRASQSGATKPRRRRLRRKRRLFCPCPLLARTFTSLALWDVSSHGALQTHTTRSIAISLDSRRPCSQSGVLSCARPAESSGTRDGGRTDLSRGTSRTIAVAKCCKSDEQALHFGLLLALYSIPSSACVGRPGVRSPHHFLLMMS